MAKFLELLFEETKDTVLHKTTVYKKFNEAGVPLTWNRLCLTRIYFEKKVVMPPFTPNKKVTLVLPLKSPEENLSRVEEEITNILINKIDKEQEAFKLPVRLADIQKEYQLQLKINEPPLFVVTKQLETEMDTFFYKVLESRNVIKDAIVAHLKEKYPE